MGLEDADGQTLAYTYDALDRQSTAAYPAPAVPTGDDLAAIAFAYDPNNNPVSIVETWTGVPNSRQTARSYDAFDRLQAVTDRYGLSLTYTYDPAGNRTSLQDPDNNVTRYTYDALNRLSAVTIPAAGITTYDNTGTAARAYNNYINMQSISNTVLTAIGIVMTYMLS